MTNTPENNGCTQDEYDKATDEFITRVQLGEIEIYS